MLEETNIKINKTDDIKKYRHEYYISKGKQTLFKRVKCTECDLVLYKGNMTKHIKRKHTDKINKII